MFNRSLWSWPILIPIAALYGALNPHKKLLFLATLSAALTVAARDFYSDDARRLKGLNEIQHKVLWQLAKALAGDIKRYPDEVLFASVYEIAADANCESQLAYGVSEAERLVHMEKW